MKQHFCPTCEQPYGCPRNEPRCGSPEVYDCHACYLRRHRVQLQALTAEVAARFDDHGCYGYGDLCNAH